MGLPWRRITDPSCTRVPGGARAVPSRSDRRISQPNLSAYEHDRRSPTADTLNRIVVACGYELAAVAGARSIFAPLPRAGWFPDEDVPPPDPGDPPDERPTVTPTTPMARRLRVIAEVLALAEATR